MVAEGYRGTYDKPLELSSSLDMVVNRIRKYGFDVAKENTNKNDVALVITWHREDLSWQILKYLLNENSRTFIHLEFPGQFLSRIEKSKKSF